MVVCMHVCVCVCPVLCGRVWPGRCVHAASSVSVSLAYISVCVCQSAVVGVGQKVMVCSGVCPSSLM